MATGPENPSGPKLRRRRYHSAIPLGTPPHGAYIPHMTDQNTPNSAEIDPASAGPVDRAPADPDAALRDRLADAVVAEAAFEGWTRTALATAGRQLDLPAGEVDRLFPGGPIQVLTHASELADRRTVRDMEAEGVLALKIRDRIKAAVRIRLERHAGNREAARRALAVLSLPFNAGLGLKLLYKTVDALWYAAGDTSTDFNFYTKRATLAGVYSSTLLYWLNDRSPGAAETWSFSTAASTT
jgi:ubiquinone biosynthesis protein COQ9